ncbi:hypothetical protein JCM10207_007949 [Rhodosporidiobolus poonsookiae]
MSSDIWDDDGWEDMPVIKSSELATASAYDAPDDDDRKRSRYLHPAPARMLEQTGPSGYGPASGAAAPTGNATGKAEEDEKGEATGLREKEKLDEMDYTRLELDDDPDEDEISMRTQYLFNEDTSMTPLSQMQQTKTLLTEGQRIAYVGLCRLVAREMVQTLALAAKGAKELDPAKESAQVWANKIMGRLYRHMEVDAAEQRMIELLAEHGVTSEDLVPSLVATHTIDNPDYDPEAAERAAQEGDITFESEDQRLSAKEKETKAVQKRDDKPSREELVAELDDRLGDMALGQEEQLGDEPTGYVKREVRKIERRTSEAATYDSTSSPGRSPRPQTPDMSSPLRSPRSPTTPSRRTRSAFDMFDSGDGDIGGALDEPPTPTTAKAAPSDSSASAPDYPSANPATARPASPVEGPSTPRAASPAPPYEQSPPPASHQPDDFLSPLPSTLPGVSTSLTHLDRTVTLDIRWTILCDLFLSLIADSVYDARSRVLLGKMADKLGLEWTDVIRFERRLTEALEIQEAVKEKAHDEVLESRRLKDKKTRYLMMGLATVGGGLVIGLSAGLLAPVIGAGLGAALTTVGVTGTSSFLAGAGGAAIISSGATLTGMNIGGRAMARRTRHVKTFEVLPLHNNKRVNYILTVPGFMSGKHDDVRLPFSTIDPVMGDVLSVLWEPDMMGDTGATLKILTSEVLTQAGQQVLAATVMTALMSALQWPMMLTKLSYLIDNPWSNALDRARQAGQVLADILLNRRLGVRPVSLIGFSLGARVIFFALVELAKQNAFGIVQEVYLFGATVTASNKVWRQVRGIVAGRFVNGFAMNDWLLGYLFRATTGGLQTVAGLRPIEHVPDLENVDVTHLLEGHLSYRPRMPKLLAYVGFKTNADHFDEPDVDPDAPDREVLTKEEEEARREKKERKGLGIFRRKKKAAAGAAGAAEGGDGTESAEMSRQNSQEEYDLPPRLSGSTTSLGGKEGSYSSSRNASSLSLASTAVSEEHELEKKGGEDDDEEKERAEPAKEHAPQATPVPDAASPALSRSDSTGFNLDKLRAEVAQLPKPSPERASSVPPEDLPTVASLSSAAADIPRAPSAPVPTEPPQTDLTHLDQSLDPRELLRRQWNNEPVPPVDPSSLSAMAPPFESGGWGASTASLPDDHYAASFSFPSPSADLGASTSDAPSFTFSDPNGFLSSSSSAAPSSNLDAESTPKSELPSFTFGSSTSFDNAASLTFGGADGSFTSSSSLASPWGSNADPSDGAKKDDDAPDPAGAFVWGSTAGKSSSTGVDENPW